MAKSYPIVIGSSKTRTKRLELTWRIYLPRRSFKKVLYWLFRIGDFQKNTTWKIKKKIRFEIFKLLKSSAVDRSIFGINLKWWRKKSAFDGFELNDQKPIWRWNQSKWCRVRHVGEVQVYATQPVKVFTLLSNRKILQFKRKEISKRLDSKLCYLATW